MVLFVASGGCENFSLSIGGLAKVVEKHCHVYTFVYKNKFIEAFLFAMFSVPEISKTFLKML